MGFTILGLIILGLCGVLDPIFEQPIGQQGPVGYVESYKEEGFFIKNEEELC